MKKLLLIIALLVSLGVVGTMLGESASAQYFRIPMATVTVGPGFCAPACGWAARSVRTCVPVCAPYCAPVYTCAAPVKKAAKAKDTKPKVEKKEKKDKKDKK
jgi:hypothetical protein